VSLGNTGLSSAHQHNSCLRCSVTRQNSSFLQKSFLKEFVKAEALHRVNVAEVGLRCCNYI